MDAVGLERIAAWAALVGGGLTLGGTLVMIAVAFGKLRAEVNRNTKALENGLMSEVKGHGVLLARLQVTQGHLITDVGKLTESVEKLHDRIDEQAKA